MKNDEGEQRMDDEWTDEEIMKDTIEYYKDKDRHMIELVGELRAENKVLDEALEQVCLELAEATKQLDLAHEWVRTQAGWKTHDNYTDFVYFTQQQTHAKEESE